MGNMTSAPLSRHHSTILTSSWWHLLLLNRLGLKCCVKLGWPWATRTRKPERSLSPLWAHERLLRDRQGPNIQNITRSCTRGRNAFIPCKPSYGEPGPGTSGLAAVQHCKQLVMARPPVGPMKPKLFPGTSHHAASQLANDPKPPTPPRNKRFLPDEIQ